MPVYRAARWRPGADVQLQHRRRLGIRFVVGVVANHFDHVAGDVSRLVAAQAGRGLVARRHSGARRDRRRNPVGDHVHELSRTGELCRHEPARPFADVAFGAGDARVRAGTATR